MSETPDDNIIHEAPLPKKKSLIKRILKVFLYLFLGIIGLNAILYLLLSIPAVQQRVIDFVIGQIQPIVKTEISIDRVRLTLFNHVNLQGVYVESQEKDTLLYAGELDVRLNIWGLLNNNLQIKSIELDKAYVNVSQKTPDSPFNFQFLIDAFAGDTTQVEDTTSSGLNISINNISVTNSRISYNILSEPETPSLFNPSHINISDFNTHIKLKSIDIMKLNAEILSLSLIEQSGLTVKNIEGSMRSKGFSLWSDKFRASLSNSDLQIDSLRYNLFTKEFQGKLTSNLSPKDLKIVMSELRYLEENIRLDANLSGKLPEVRITKLDANYGNEMLLQANAFIADYEHYDKSKIRLEIEQFRATPKAITNFARIGDSTFVAPDMLATLGALRLNSLAEGTLDNMKLNAEAWVNQGSLQLNSHISVKDTSFQNFTVDASLQSMNFNLAPFFDNELKMGRMSLRTGFSVVSKNGNLTAKIGGTVERLERDTITIRDIRFGGEYNQAVMSAWIKAPLSIGDLRATASMTQERRSRIKFDVDVHDLQIDRFYDNPSWTNPRLSLCLNGDIRFGSMDDIEGEVAVDSLVFKGDGFNYEPGRFTLASSVTPTNKYIELKSSFFNAKVDGEYRLSSLADEFSNVMSAYLPGMFPYNKRVRKYNNDFNITAELYNTETISRIFELPVDVIRPINLKGNINTIDGVLKMNADIPHLRFGTNEVKNTTISIYNNESKLNVDLDTRLSGLDQEFIAKLTNAIEADTISTLLAVNNENGSLNVDGKLEMQSHFHTTKLGDLHSFVQFTPSNINIGDLRLMFMPGRIENANNRTTVSNFGFNVGVGRMMSKYFAVDGAISEQKQDTLKVQFMNARIGDVLRPFNVNNVTATVDGTLKLTNLLDKPEFYTRNLQARDIIVFGDTLGDLSVSSRWNNEANAIGLRAALTHNDISSKVQGLVFLNDEKMKMNIDLEKLSIKWLQPFMADMLTKVEGSISSRIALSGSFSAPNADGWLGFNNTRVGVNFTNVTYNISDTIKVFKDKVGFRDLIIRDNDNNKATMSALVDYEDLDNLNFVMKLVLDNFLVLNTQSRTDSLFYGNLKASGDVRVRGNMDDIKVDMNIRNERRSTINITIPEAAEASQYQEIAFINVPEQDSSGYVAPVAESPIPLSLNMNLQLNPGIDIAVIMNSSNPLNMHMKGEGLIAFKYDMMKDIMEAVGDYTITEGVVQIRPQNIKTLKFNIRRGSTLSMTGDPMKTSFNITAFYRVNASLSNLDNSLSRSKVPVDCVLGMKGNLDKMELTYAIELPDASDDIRQKVRALINTDEQKTLQFGNLVLLGAFRNQTGDDGSSNMLGSVVSSTLSGALNSLLGNVLGNNWQIGANVETEDGSFTDANVTVNASTRLLDDRLTVSTNLGYRSDQASNAYNNNNFIGDFDVEYQLSNTVKLRGYTHTNDQFYKQAATTQGIGVVYTKEAKTLRELFSFFRRKKKDNKTAVAAGN